MNHEQHAAMTTIGTMLETTDILLGYLRAGDEDKSYEAISVMLMQALDMYGANSIVFQQFSPVMRAIESNIAKSNLSGAMRQAESFKAQLNEVRQIVLGGRTS